MFITRESDYAMRVIRALMWEPRLSVSEICERESITAPFAYKILKKLQNAGLVEGYRGVHGGYALKRDPEELSLYEIYSAIDPDMSIIECLNRTEFPAMHMMSFRRSRISCGQCSVGNP